MHSFLKAIEEIPDHRVTGMITYPLNEVLLSTLVGVLCGADDWDVVELLSQEYLPWLQQFLPFKDGIPQAQTYRKIFSVLPSTLLEESFGKWMSSVREHVREVIAIDGKTLRGSKQNAKGKDALHVLSAYACETGLVIGQQAVDGKGNEITAIPELLDRLMIKGCIISIDAMGTQKNIAAKIAEKKADYVLALKGNQHTLHEDVKTFFEDIELIKECASCTKTDVGHGRIEERTSCVTDNIEWLQARHPDWPNLCSIAVISSTRTDKSTGTTSQEMRFYISSLPADPELLLDTTRTHWGIENNLHWQLDVTFNEDYCRTRKDFSPLNFSLIRRFALNMLKLDKSKLSLRRKRIKAAVNPIFRAKILAC